MLLACDMLSLIISGQAQKTFEFISLTKFLNRHTVRYEKISENKINII